VANEAEVWPILVERLTDDHPEVTFAAILALEKAAANEEVQQALLLQADPVTSSHRLPCEIAAAALMGAQGGAGRTFLPQLVARARRIPALWETAEFLLLEAEEVRTMKLPLRQRLGAAIAGSFFEPPWRHLFYRLIRGRRP
jgi:hypothetical protein